MTLWVNVRVSRPVYESLREYRNQLQVKDDQNRKKIDPGRECRNVTLSDAVRALLESVDSHRDRARKSAGYKTRKAPPLVTGIKNEPLAKEAGAPHNCPSA